MTLRIFLTFLAITTVTLHAGIGDTMSQLSARYGPPKDSSVTEMTDKTSPLLDGAIHHTYEYSGWKIRAAFLQANGGALRMTYQKASASGVTGVTIRDDELQAIMVASTLPGMTWKEATPQARGSKNTGLAKLFETTIMAASGAKVWIRNDGARLELQSRMKALLEIPEAAAYEERLKADKEGKAKAAVPKF